MKQSATNLEHTKTYPATTIADAASQTGRGAEGLSLSLFVSLLLHSLIRGSVSYTSERCRVLRANKPSERAGRVFSWWRHRASKQTGPCACYFTTEYETAKVAK